MKNMLDSRINRNKFQKQIIIPNIINSIYLLLLCFMTFIEWREITVCKNSAKMLLENTSNMNRESVVAGYQLIGGIFGTGALSFVVAILYFLLIINLIYILLFLAENISSYIIYTKLKKEECSNTLVKRIRTNAIIKCILALLVITPMFYFLFSEQWYIAVIVIIPQIVVIILSIKVIKLLWNKHNKKVEIPWEQ